MGTHVGEEQWERMLRRGRLKCVLSDGLLVGFQRSDTGRCTSKRRRWSLRIEVAAGRQDRQELELIGMTHARLKVPMMILRVENLFEIDIA